MELLDGRRETPKERLDRNLNELLGELRVALPGVQVLFAFLLTVPFNQRFSTITAFDRDVYFVTLILTAIASLMLIAPSVYHRLEFRHGDKAQVVEVGNRFTIVGFGFLAAAMTGVILLVTDFLFGSPAAPIASGTAALLFLTVWFLLPLRRRYSRRRAPAPRPSSHPN